LLALRTLFNSKMSRLVSGNTDAPIVVTNEEASVLILLNSLSAYQLRKLSTLRPQNVRRMRGSIGRNWPHSGTFGLIQQIFFNDLGGKHLAPKAEVTGSNPVGCANDFNWLRDWFEGSGLGYVRLILAVVTPFVLGVQNRTSFEFRQLEMDSKRQ
jgi:hypothetical protein